MRGAGARRAQSFHAADYRGPEASYRIRYLLKARTDPGSTRHDCRPHMGKCCRMPKHPADQFLIKPHSKFRVKHFDPAWDGGEESKQAAEKLMARNLERLANAQDLLWATERYAILIVLQAMDTA